MFGSLCLQDIPKLHYLPLPIPTRTVTVVDDARDSNKQKSTVDVVGIFCSAAYMSKAERSVSSLREEPLCSLSKNSK